MALYRRTIWYTTHIVLYPQGNVCSGTLYTLSFNTILITILSDKTFVCKVKGRSEVSQKGCSNVTSKAMDKHKNWSKTQ